MNLGLLDALDAIGALFHNATHTHGNVGVLLHLWEIGWVLRQFSRSERSFVVVASLALIVVEEVETADLIGTVIRAIAGADATIVSHGIKTLVVVHGGVGGTDGLARSRFAMLTSDTHKGDLRVHGNFLTSLIAAIEEVAVEANPLHVASLEDLIAADDRDIILGLAGDRTSVAARAGIEVDRHTPLLQRWEFGLVTFPDGDIRGGRVVRMLVSRITTRGGGRLQGGRHRAILAVNGRGVAINPEFGERFVLLHVFDTALADDVAAFHRPMILHIADGDGFVGEFELCARAIGRRSGADKRIDVETVALHAASEAFVDARRNATSDGATETKLQAHGEIREARHNEDGSLDRVAVDRKFGDSTDEAAIHQLIDVTVKRPDFIDEQFARLDVEFGGEVRADENDVFPSSLRHGIRSLSQPTVISISTVA